MKQLLVEAAWAAAASNPMCMLSLDRTDDGITVCGRTARRIPRRSWFFSFLHRTDYLKKKPGGKRHAGCNIWEKCTGVSTEEVKQYQMKRTESPATSLLALTNTLQPVVRRCRLGCPAGKRRKYEQMIAYLVHVYQLHTSLHCSFHIQPVIILLSNILSKRILERKKAKYIHNPLTCLDISFCHSNSI